MVHLISAGVLLPRGWMKSGSSSAVGLKDAAGLSCSPQRLNPNSPGQGFCSPAFGGRGRGLVPSHPAQAELWVLVESAGPEGEERRAAQDATASPAPLCWLLCQLLTMVAHGTPHSNPKMSLGRQAGALSAALSSLGDFPAFYPASKSNNISL